MTIEQDIETEVELMNVVSNMLKERRSHLEISQQTLAEVCGGSTDQAWISRLENNKKKEISLWMFYKVINSLNGKINFEFEN